MDLTWIDRNAPRERDLAGVVAVLEAARLVDAPDDTGPLTSQFASDLRHGWDGEPADVAVSRNAAGKPVAMLEVSMPEYDNRHLGWVGITVHPAHRRKGLGTALYRVAVDKIRAAGRSLVLADGWADGPAEKFAPTVGLTVASRAIRREQDLASLDLDRIAGQVELARGAATGYELLRITGAVPAEMLADVAAMTAAINDAPTDDLDIEDEVFTVERIRAFETAQFARGRRMYRIVARELSTGDLAGHTVVVVEREKPWLCWQLDTSVLAAHRGHRLGMLLKGDMLLWLAEEEPQLASIATWNAASNDHMIAVNEELGYRVVRGAVEFQLHL